MHAFFNLLLGAVPGSLAIEKVSMSCFRADETPALDQLKTLLVHFGIRVVEANFVRQII